MTFHMVLVCFDGFIKIIFDQIKGWCGNRTYRNFTKTLFNRIVHMISTIKESFWPSDNPIKCLSHFEWFFKHHIWYRMFTQSVRTTQQHFQTLKRRNVLLNFSPFLHSFSKFCFVCIEKGKPMLTPASLESGFSLLTSKFLQTLWPRRKLHIDFKKYTMWVVIHYLNRQWQLGKELCFEISSFFAPIPTEVKKSRSNFHQNLNKNALLKSFSSKSKWFRTFFKLYFICNGVLDSTL